MRSRYADILPLYCRYTADKRRVPPHGWTARLNDNLSVAGLTHVSGFALAPAVVRRLNRGRTKAFAVMNHHYVGARTVIKLPGAKV